MEEKEKKRRAGLVRKLSLSRDQDIKTPVQTNRFPVHLYNMVRLASARKRMGVNEVIVDALIQYFTDPDNSELWPLFLDKEGEKEMQHLVKHFPQHESAIKQIKNKISSNL